MKQSFFLCLVVLLFAVQAGIAQIPQTISYQGVLTDTGGTPAPSGNYDFTFQLYDVATGGTAIWTETQTGVAVANGIFEVILGSVNPLNLPFDSQYWLGITIGAGSELSPRIELTSSAYSLSTSSADSGDITAVNAGDGLTGGGAVGDVTLDVGVGTGITVAADQVSLNTSFTDGIYVNEGQTNSVSTAMIQNNAVSVDKVSPNMVSSLNNVTNDGGNIDLVAGSNVNIVANDTNNTITISSSGGTGGGDITAVNAGSGLTGGGTTGDVTLDVGAGTGITVAADQVSLNTTYTDAQYVNEAQSNSISSTMIQNGQVSNADLANNAVNSAKIQDGEVQQADIATGAVTTNEILNGTIQGADLANQSVNENKIDPTNANAGEALIYDGASVVWQIPGGQGDITSVTAGSGLTGGGTSGDVNLDVNAGTGITVAADQVSLNTTYADARYVNEGQGNSISSTMIQNDAVTLNKIFPDLVSSLDGVSNDGGDIDIVQGSNITVTPDNVAKTITIAAPNVGDITAVNAGDGLTGGGASGNVTLDIGAGTGITVAADQVSLNTAYTDGQYVNEGQTNSISSTMIQNDAVTLNKIFPDLISSLDGVSNDGGNIDIVQGTNITVTPDNVAKTITIAAPNAGDITAVNAGNGLTGGGTSGNVTLDIGAGTGITVAADQVSLNTSYTDGLYVNEGQANSINSSMIQNGQVNNADLANTAVTTAKISGSGGVANDVLTYDGQNVVWQAVPADQDWTISGGNVYRASGSVGIGTTSPAARTHVKGAGTGTSQALLVTNSANAVNLTLFDNGNLGLGDQGPDAILEIVQRGTTDLLNLSSSTSGDGDLVTVTNLGEVGIGTTSPNGQLHVSTNKLNAGYFTSGLLSSSTHAVHGQFTGSGAVDARGVYGLSDAADGWGYGGDFIGGYTGARGFTDAGTYTGSGFGIRGQAIGTAGTRYGVYGTASGGTANYAVYAAGDLAYSGNLIGPPGDAIFKENVRPLTAALSKVMQLNGKSFQYSQNEKYAHMNLPTGEHYGLIVQEVEQVFPELVTENTHPSAAETRGEKKDDPPVQYKGLKYMELIPILIEAVKEQQQEIEALKAEISALKSSK